MVQKNFNIKEVTFPNDIISESFNYDPMVKSFSDGILQDSYKNIISSVKLNSYSAIVPSHFLNDAEKSSGINGMGVIFDLIVSCLNVNSDERPNLTELAQSDLFKFDKYEKLVLRKFASNAIKCYSGEEILIKQIIYPLRDVLVQL